MSGTIINRVVIHGLNKEKGKGVEKTDWGKILDVNSDGVVKLLDAILDAYGKKHNRVQYGTFCEPKKRGKFADALETYAISPGVTDQDFMDLSETAVNELIRTATNTPAATGGYIVFYDYERQGTNFYLVAMVKQRPGLRINEKMIPELLMEVETNKLHQAARINFEKLNYFQQATEEEKEELGYLNFLSPSARAGATTYFITALDCNAGVATSRATESVIQEAGNLFLDDDRLKSNYYEMRTELVGFLGKRAKDKIPVRLSEVGEILRKYIPHEYADDADEITHSFIDALNGEEQSVPFQFNVNASTANKYSRVNAKTQNWSFNVELSILGDTPDAAVYYDRDNETLTFNNIPSDVKIEILKDLDYRE